MLNHIKYTLTPNADLMAQALEASVGEDPTLISADMLLNMAVHYQAADRLTEKPTQDVSAVALGVVYALNARARATHSPMRLLFVPDAALSENSGDDILVIPWHFVSKHEGSMSSVKNIFEVLKDDYPQLVSDAMWKED